MSLNSRILHNNHVMKDGFIDDSDNDLMIEQDKEHDKIMHFVFGEDSDSDCDAYF